MISERDKISDAELIRRCRHHDDEAFLSLYGKYRLPLFSFIQRFLPHQPDLADDMFQQTWCKVIASWDKYDERNQFFAWLCRIAHNLICSHFRKQHPQIEDSSWETLPDEKEEILDTLHQEELQTALAQAIETLPPEQKKVVKMRQKGISFQAIAKETNVSINTALGRMRYALDSLRKSLRDFLP